MHAISGTGQPFLKRLDHLICEVRDIEEAMDLFTGRLGFPVAWPIGRFWPGARTSGIALGGLNLEFVQPDVNAPAVAAIRTLVFEPVSVDLAASRLRELGVETELREKWEPEPKLLKLRGFSEEEAREPQLICRNLIPLQSQPIDFFLCEYVPSLRQRLSPESFAGLSPVSSVVISVPEPASSSQSLDRVIGLPRDGESCEILIDERPGERAEVTEIHSDRGPLDLGSWPSRFHFA